MAATTAGLVRTQGPAGPERSYDGVMQPVNSVTLDETIGAIRDAYEEAKQDYNNQNDSRRMFLFGMRYVMCILGMPEGQSDLSDEEGTRGG